MNKPKAPNKQLYINSPLRSLMAESIPVDPEAAPADTFFNAKDPNLAILHERPEHRNMIWMKARGSSNAEIARVCGYTDAWVSQVLRQPWAQRVLLDEMNKAGRDELHTILEGAAADSLLKLIELRDTAPPTVAKAAADSLLDRYLGKPTQRVETAHSTHSDANSIEELEKQIEALGREEKRLRGENVLN
jgi:hypothetical protein